MVTPGRAGAIALLLGSAVVALATAAPAFAYHHHDSPVAFEDYADDVVARNLEQGRPYFLLFSAEWCHWCHEFAEGALDRDDVYTYLNRHFVNVFIDADIHNAAYARYRATGLPYVVFLKPDGSVHFRYSGTVYADQFVEVLRDIRQTIDAGLSIPGQGIELDPYVAPETLEVEALDALARSFTEGILENFDPREHGVGRGEKTILPRTFLYLLEHARDEEREAVVEGVGGTLDRAIEAIYDPVEGGFFRYAETRDWRVPHYEKMADLNAGAVLVLHRLDELSSSPARAGARERTTEYLQSTLYEPRLDTFLSFQGADTRYFRLDAAGRETARAPVIADKVFTDRLAGRWTTCLGSAARGRRHWERHGRRPSSFHRLDGRRAGSAGVTHCRDGTWHGDSLPRDYALVARVFQKAARRFSEPRFARIAHGVVQSAVGRFYEAERGIFVDPSFDGDDSTEYLMETNALLALAIMRLDEDVGTRRMDVVKSAIEYFRVGDLSTNGWGATEWEIWKPTSLLEAIDASWRSKSLTIRSHAPFSPAVSVGVNPLVLVPSRTGPRGRRLTDSRMRLAMNPRLLAPAAPVPRGKR